MKNNRNGQSSVITDSDYSKIRKQIKSRKYKLLLDLAWYTGERWGALVQLTIADCYNPDGTPRSEITFKATTRKAGPDGKRQTRQVPIHPVLAESLLNYTTEDSVWLFPSREGDKPISIRWADKILRAAVARAGMDAKGISTHSTRRSFITKLHGAGVDLYTIQRITGHRDLKCLGRYVEISADRIKGAIYSL
ncbi:tyrosine-type recombinase/integrase [Anabaena subtropica]|uniref:Tyrosine-type recombinase/integrase n=1 Tax=Anabaena subtropica FACHB-260 TaxID=2692884 RepID=A0ABR8CQV8_9NOST|nr:tyrosine-type recombinase/integrase [Anabaena subtropica]MBD2344175.1 tyrosine-type recombinase/integrase [Anabaena subtropica FACHB-260]